MTKPTIREILTDFDITDPKHEALAERVEAVLRLTDGLSEVLTHPAALKMAKAVRRALEGE